MRCAACALDLEAEDNYCRRCGAPVRVLGVQTIPEQSQVVRVGPSEPALLAGAARPLATGAAVVAAAALMRFAARRAVRGILGGPATRSAPDTRAVPPSRPAARGGHSVEMFWYRRVMSGE